MIILTGMRIGVYLHVNLLMESLATVLTNKWFVVGMGPHVSMKVRCSVEGLQGHREEEIKIISTVCNHLFNY